MTKARTLADFISDGSPLADGTISVSEVSGAAPLASPTFTGTTTLDATVLHDSDNGNQKFTITRQGSSDQAGTMYVDDATFVFDSVQDEAGGASFIFRGTNGTVTNQKLLELVPNGEAIFNQDGANIDFRVESDGNTHALFVDASNNRVGLFTSSPSVALEVLDPTSNFNGAIHIGGSGSSRRLVLEQSDVLTYKIGGTGTNSITQLVAGGTAGVGTVYTTLDQDGLLSHNRGAVFNETGGDNDFRVESDNKTHMLFVDAGNNSVGIGTGSPVASGEPTVTIGSRTIVGKTVGNQSLFSDNAYFTGSTWTTKETGSWASIRTNNNSIRFHTGGTHTAGTSLTAMDSSSMRLYISDTETVFNEVSTNTDFRVESDTNNHALFVDAGNNIVNVGTSSPSAFAGRFNVASGTTTTAASFESALGGAGAACHIFMGVSTRANKGLQISSVGNGASILGGSLAATIYNTEAAQLALGGNNVYNQLILSSSEIVANENSYDQDFRVESDANANAFVVNAGTGRVGVNNSNPTYTFEVGSGSQENMGIGWARLEYFTVGIPSSGTRWYKLANYATTALQGQLYMMSARNGGANQTNGARMQHGSLAGYNGSINSGDWGDVGTNYGHVGYYVAVGGDANIYLRVNGSVYGGEVYCQFQGRANWVFDGTYVTSAP